MGQPIRCQKCKFYFVTWEKDRPHGCHGYGFKSPSIPSVMVKRTSGNDCMLFELKDVHKK